VGGAAGILNRVVGYEVNDAMGDFAFVENVWPVERDTAEAEARIVTMNYTFTSRPSKYVRFNARYRFYDYDNRTPQFGTTSMVVSDLSLGAAQENEPPSYNRQNLDVDVTVEPVNVVAVKVGYGRRANDYSGKVRTEGGGSIDSVFRIFKNVDEDVFRVSGDSLGNQYVSVRGQYEFSRRRGAGTGPRARHQAPRFP